MRKRAPQGDGTAHVQMLSNPRVPKIMLEGGLCSTSERPIAASAWPEGKRGGVKVNIYFSHTFCMRDHMKVNIQTLNATKCTKVPYI